MKTYDFLIVGAGLYGCVMAERLTAAGKSVLVIDKRDTIGGNCASKNINGIDVHLYGPHVFHTNDKTVWNYINRFGEFRQFTHKVMSYYRYDVYNFPINRKTKFDLLNYLNYNKFSDDEYIRDAFFKEYSEKQWGCDFADVPKNALKRIPFRDNYNDAYFDDYYQGVPVDGWNNIFEKMTNDIDIMIKSKFLYMRDSEIAKNIIYTGPIDQFYNYQFGRLDWRSLKFNIIEKPIQDFQGISVMHYPEKKYPCTRITEFKHFNPFNEAYKKDFTVYAVEIPCSLDENPDEPYYPVETEKNLELYAKYKKLADAEKNVYFGGRLATYSYNNMDTTIKNALTDAEKIIKDAR